MRRLSAIFPLLILGCGGGDAPPPAAASDSAGIAVVRNAPEGAWEASSPWHLEEELRIGGLDAPIEEQFGAIPTATGLVVDGDGSIYALDAQARHVRAFAADGAFLRTIGQPGDGPGELGEGLTAILLGRGGEIVIPDLGKFSLQRFAPDGSYVGANRLPISLPDESGGGSAFFPRRWATIRDGQLVVQITSLSVPDFGTGSGEGSFSLAPLDVIVALDEDASPSDTLLEIPTTEVLGESNGLIPQMTLFAPETVWAADPGGRFYTARTSSFRITVHSLDGLTDRVIELSVEPRPVREVEKSAIRDAILEELEERAPGMSQFLDVEQMFTFPEFYPVLTSLLAGPDGTLWVQGTRPLEEAAEFMSGFSGPNVLAGGNPGTAELGGPQWHVFDAEGRYLGEVEMPERFMPTLWKGDALYGLQRDELDVQSILRLRLVR